MSILYCEVNDTQLYYEKSGQGRPLLLLHGNGETHQIFNRAIPILRQYYTVYAIDSRGHGNSKDVAVFHYDDLVQDIVCFIEKLELEKPILYGFSDGGIVGLLLASRYPNLLSQLIISGANMHPNGIRKSWLTLFQLINTFVHDPKMDMMLQEPNIAKEILQKIQIPTMVIAGGRDMVKRSHTKYIASCIPKSRLQIVWWSGHGGYIVHRKKIAYLILEAITQ